ncbi:hypothetical protein F7725_002491 [Dissostichus mawsoni]|uniref:Armadillo repeat-containing protein 8 n=1 Tax=Dissostichus mawsoni TaxID=36200 RepID=A0A7J5Y2I2_DISMA|nr:hypothetical protein F7725_002491 [Dissostichus mawsoni]
MFDPDPQKVLQGVIDMKNAVIGNNKQKANLIVLGAVPRLLYLLQQSSSSLELRTECAVVLGSLAMGTENNIKSLVDCHIIPALLQGLLCPDLIFIEACLRCLRTVFISPVTPVQLLYTVRMQALKCFSVLAYENTQVSMTLVNVLVDGELLSQVFVRMMQRDQPIEMQLTAAKWVEGAETLAYLMEPDVELQRIASTTDHLVAMLADYFKYPSSVSAITDIKRLDHDLKHAHELRQAAFKLYASLGSNDEDIRKKITETENMMDRIVSGLSESSIKVRLAAVRCLHSLSRSVQQLRTSFHDHAVWKPLMKSDSPALRVNGIWALMADQKVKVEIVRCLGTEQLFRLLSDPDSNVLMKTLGLLRNLLSTRPHIDQIMSSHGKQILQAVTLILEAEHSVEVKEQGHSNVKLQLAATFCISNLIWNEEDVQAVVSSDCSPKGQHSSGSQERQDKLREMGFVDILHKLTQASDPNLCDRWARRAKSRQLSKP